MKEKTVKSKEVDLEKALKTLNKMKEKCLQGAMKEYKKKHKEVMNEAHIRIFNETKGRWKRYDKHLVSSRIVSLIRSLL